MAKKNADNSEMNDHGLPAHGREADEHPAGEDRGRGQGPEGARCATPTTRTCRRCCASTRRARPTSCRELHRGRPGSGRSRPRSRSCSPRRCGSTQPWLEWAGKREEHERGFFDVDPVALHIHERVSAQAMLRGWRARTSSATSSPTRSSPTGGGAVLPARRGLGEPADPRRLAAGDVVARPPREPRRQGPDDLHGPAVRHQVLVATSSPRSASATSRRRSRT